MRSLILSAIALCAMTACAASEVRCESRRPSEERRVTNGVVSVAACKHDAGAVCSIVYGGHEFVNDFDHGRQLQVAWSYNDAGEGYNPTEAGSGDDFTKPSSTSELLSLRVRGNEIRTESHPAYWRRPGKGLNSSAVTRDTLKKTVTLGYLDNPHVIVLDSAVSVAADASGPPVKKMRIETPAFYTSSALTEHYQLDRRTGALTKLAPAKLPDVKDRMNARMGLNTDRLLVPVMASPDGRYAVAAYTPAAKDFWTYSTYGVPSDLAANACNKLSVRFEHPASAGATYSYRTFVVIGDLATVTDAVMKLP